VLVAVEEQRRLRVLERVLVVQRVVRVLLEEGSVVQYLVVGFERLLRLFSEIHSVWFVRLVEAFDTSLRGWHKRLDPRNSFQNE
jgi:hypothetical protein